MANVVLLYAPHWTPAPELQAKSRVDRPGQTKAVRCVGWVLLHTIEDHVYATGQGKTRRLAQWGADGYMQSIESSEDEEEDNDDATFI